MLAIKNLPVYFILIIAPVLYHVDRSLPGITAGFTGVLLIILCSVFFSKYKKFRFNLLDLFFLLFVVWYTGRTVGIGSSMHAWKLLLGCTAVLLYAYIRNVGLKRHYFDILFVAGGGVRLVGILFNCRVFCRHTITCFPEQVVL